MFHVYELVSVLRYAIVYIKLSSLDLLISDLIASVEPIEEAVRYLDIWEPSMKENTPL